MASFFPSYVGASCKSLNTVLKFEYLQAFESQYGSTGEFSKQMIKDKFQKERTGKYGSRKVSTNTKKEDRKEEGVYGSITNTEDL